MGHLYEFVSVCVTLRSGWRFLPEENARCSREHGCGWVGVEAGECWLSSLRSDRNGKDGWRARAGGRGAGGYSSRVSLRSSAISRGRLLTVFEMPMLTLARCRMSITQGCRCSKDLRGGSSIVL